MTDDTQKAESTEQETPVVEETTLEQELEANLTTEEPIVTEGSEAPEIEVTDEDIAAELAAMEPGLEPNPMWAREYRERFAKLGELEGGREYQQAMLDLYGETQGEATRRQQEAAELRKFAEPIQQALEPYQNFIASTGQTPDAMVRNALALAMRLSQDPQATLQGLAQRAGIDLTQLGENAPYVDPETQRLRDEVTAIRRQQAQREQHAMQQQRQQVIANIDNQLRTFQEAKDEQGNSLYPHLKIVENQMATLIRGNPQMSLEDAYHNACKLTPEVAEAEAKEQERREAARKAAIARKEKLAAQRVTGNPGTSTPVEGSLEDEITKNLRAKAA